MQLKTLLSLTTLAGVFTATASAITIPNSSGQNTSSGSITGATDNPSPVSNSLSITGAYAAGNQGSNGNGSWSVNTGGTFAYRGVAVSSESNVQSFNPNAEVYARGFIDFGSTDALTFDAVETFTLTFRIHASAQVGFSGDSQSSANGHTASYAGTVIIKNPDSGSDTFTNVYGGTTAGSTSISGNASNTTNSDSNTFTATIAPGQGLLFIQNVDLDTGQTADANGVGLSGESGTSSAYVSGGIDLLSFKIGGVETDAIQVFAQSGEDYFSPVPESSIFSLLCGAAAIGFAVTRRRSAQR